MSDIIPAIAILEIEMEERSVLAPIKFNGLKYYKSDVTQAITTASGSGNSQDQFIIEEPKIMQIGSYVPNGKCAGKVVNPSGISPTVMENHGTVTAVIEPSILSPTRTEIQRQLRKQGIDTFGGRQMRPRNDGVSNTITTVQKDNLLQEQVIGSMQANAMRGSVDGVSPCLTEAMGMGGGQTPMLVQSGHGYNKGGVFEDVSPTVTSSAFQDNNHLAETRYRIRKLTPTECLRLMGVDDSDIEKMKSAKLTQPLKNGRVKERPMPKTQLYKMAGNSIVVDVLYHIFHQMFIAEPPQKESRQLTIFDYL